MKYILILSLLFLSGCQTVNPDQQQINNDPDLKQALELFHKDPSLSLVNVQRQNNIDIKNFDQKTNSFDIVNK